MAFMVGDAGAFQGGKALNWAALRGIILVNNSGEHDSAASSYSILNLAWKQPRHSIKCSTGRVKVHRDYGGRLPRLEIAKNFYRSKIGYDFKGVERQQLKRVNLVPRAQVNLAAGLEVINDLGLDTLTFLAATVVVVPAFKAIKASPILGFFLSGVVLNQLGLIRNVTDVKALSELGILFLLFEMGLELSLARLRALAKFAFGLGLAQVLLSTLAFTAFELPPNGAIGTKILEFLFHSRPDLVNIRTVDEAVVIGAALAMSSSAFVLQLLAEKGELPTRFGSATLGILLFQDIAVVPLLVVLPILESGTLGKESVWPLLAVESLKALGGLGLLSLGGQIFLRQIFEVVANSRSAEAFNALCILTVTGTSLATQKLGFSDTLGAFLAGALLAETNFRTQIEAEIQPFRGLLLGLFFVTTGTSIDIELLIREWPNVLSLLGGLIAIKTAIITALGPRTGLSLSESVRIGLLLSQGGEFAFVVFSLANRLGVLPLELNRLLIIVVVLSMSLTPFLNELGQKVAKAIEKRFAKSEEEIMTIETFEVNDPVVIIGFDQTGQVLANFLSNPLASGLGGDSAGCRFIAFDLDPNRVKAARKLGFPVLYGDGSRPVVLHTAGINTPKAVLVMYTSRQKAVQAVERLRLQFPGVPIYARAQDIANLLELKAVGATDVILENTETSLQLGSVLLRGLGVFSDEVSYLTRIMRESLELRAKVALAQKEENLENWETPFQVEDKQTSVSSTQGKVADELQNLPLKAVVTTSEVQVPPESGLLSSNIGISHDTSKSEIKPSSAQLKAAASDPQSETAARGMRAQNLPEKQGTGAEKDLADSMHKSETVTFGGPVEISVVPKVDHSGISNTRRTKVAWYERMNFSYHSEYSKLELKAADGDEDLRGVTWCALTNDDGFKDISDGTAIKAPDHISMQEQL